MATDNDSGNWLGGRKLRKLKLEETEVRVVIQQDDLAFDHIDAECRSAILLRLSKGDEWAWAFVKVIVSWQGFSAYDCLGGCSYENEEEFRKDDYFSDMCTRALDELQTTLERNYLTLKCLEQLKES